MKTRILSFLAAVAAFLTVVGALDLQGVITLLPDPVAAVLTIALPALAGVVHLVKTFGDFVDDGQINGSFKAVLLLFAIGALSFPLASCVTTSTGADGTTTTKRPDSEAINPWLDLARDIFAPPPAVSPIVPVIDSAK